MQSANSIAPTVNVLPTCRGRLQTTPPTVAAYFPSARLPSAPRTKSACHESNRIPIALHRRSTEGNAVELNSDGSTKWRATSDSLPDSVFGGAVILSRLLSRLGLQRSNLLGDQRELPVKCSLRRPTLVRDRLCNLAARSEEHTSELQSRGHLVCRLLL